jgi:hypothetical protein
MEEENTQTYTLEHGDTSDSSQDATSKWAHKRQVIYILVTVGVLLVLSIYPLFKLFYTPPSCFDGKQNQDEVGVDCGGSSCSVLCGTQVEDITVDWAKSFKVNEGVYDIAASVENPNYTAGVKDAAYTFKVYDENNSLITEKTGTVSITPRDKFIVFESGIQTNGKVPKNVVFEFSQDIMWTKMSEQAPRIKVKNKKLINIDSSPRFNATILNNSIDNLSDVEIVAVVYNSGGNPVAVSSTYEKTINKGASKDIFFTWPNKFTTRPSGGVCTAPADVALVFDRSGSMGFEGKEPPQPLTDAKNAALVFVDGMQSEDQVALVSFATDASNPIDQTLTSLQKLVQEAIKSIVIFPPALEQHTNIGDGIEKAAAELMSDRGNPKAKKAIVLLTDGVASRPLNPDKKTDKDYPGIYAHEKAVSAQDNEVSLYVIGLGDSVDEEFLKNSIATTPNYYYKAATSAGLKEIYDKIAQAVCKEESFTTDVVVHVKPAS